MPGQVIDCSRAETQRNGFNSRRKRAFLTALSDTKGNLPKAAELVGVAWSTVSNHLEVDAEFHRQVQLSRRKLSGKLIETAYDVGAQPIPAGHSDRKMLLRAWMPEEFGDRPTVAVQINGGEIRFSDGKMASE